MTIRQRLTSLPWKRLAAAAAALGTLGLIIGVTAAHMVPLPDRLDYADSTVITYQDGRVAHATLSEDDRWRFPTELDDVDTAYVEALLALEDRRFYVHPGVDPVAVIRAAADNLRAGATVSGASTITMQLVRLLEPRPRTLRSKFVEALRAVQLELRMSKDEILAAYLRFAPYGGNIEGIEAATLSFWGRTASGLTGAEIATLLAIPQNPGARGPSTDNVDTLRAARDRIAHRVADDGAIPLANRPDELEQQLADTAVVDRRGRPPGEIPHLVQWLKTHSPEAFERDETGRGEPAVRIETTLDRHVQRRAAEIVADHRRQLQARGAPHAAVVVMESDTGQVRGVVGNLSFDSAVPGSHLPAFASPRSTGSLLKPVAYAAALDEGLVAPSHQLMDVPMVRGDYRPQNFDRRWRGLVEAEEALALSLNIPFVRLVEQLSVGEFVQTMVRFELEQPVRRAGAGGLELVVGGMPASPMEVASLYAGFARGGKPVTPRMYDVDGAVTPRADETIIGGAHVELLIGAAPTSPADADTDDIQAISTPAAWLTTRALTRRPTPWSQVGPRRARDEGIVWKTGTSFAYHDAWTAGFGDRYTAAVWAGDLGFERHPQLVGADVAAPLFFELMEAIDEPFALRRATPTDQLAHIEICSRSGLRAGVHCEHTSSVEAPAKSAAPKRCNFHIEVDVDADTGRRIPDGCRPDGVDTVKQRVVERLPGPVARHERARGRRGGTIPPIHPDCRGEADATLSITSPRKESTVVLEPTRPADHQKVRLEAYSSAGSQIHWYIDGRHLDSTDADEPVYWVPEPGTWSIAAVDDRGHRDVRELVVEGRAQSRDK